MRFSFQKQFSVSFLMGEFSRKMERVCVVASMLKCDFNKVAMQLFWGHNLTWVFSCEFPPNSQDISLWENLPRDTFVFWKGIIIFIVHSKDTFTNCCHCFVHDSQIFNILQLLLAICNSSYIYLSCVHNLELCFFR